MNKSKIGYLTIGPDGRPTHTYHIWNPIGMGCSNGCPDCWARACAKRQSKKGCQDCLHFRVHFHRERLPQLAEQRKPKLVLCCFTGDWMDRERAWGEVFEISRAMAEAPQHTYITLTRCASRAAQHALYAPTGGIPDNWWTGLTIRNQADLDRMGSDFFGIPGNLWVSNEPAEGEVNWRKRFAHSIRCSSYRGQEGFTGPHCDCGRPHVKGLILGQNNRLHAPGTETLDHLKSTVEQCMAAGVNWFVKQMWRLTCFRGCWAGEDSETVHRRGEAICPRCEIAIATPKLLRASHPDEYALYPDWARGGKLPWPVERTPA